MCFTCLGTVVAYLIRLTLYKIGCRLAGSAWYYRHVPYGDPLAVKHVSMIRGFAWLLGMKYSNLLCLCSHIAYPI